MGSLENSFLLKWIPISLCKKVEMIKLNYQFSLRAVSSYFASLYYPTNMSGVDNAEDQGFLGFSLTTKVMLYAILCSGMIILM